MKDKELKIKIKNLENELQKQKEEINRLNKMKRRSKWWLAYLLWNK